MGGEGYQSPLLPSSFPCSHSRRRYAERTGTAVGRTFVELILFIGLQAAGKSSFYRARFAGTHTHVSRDNFRNNRNPSERQLVLVEKALVSGQSVVVDNTNPTDLDRAPLIERARSLGVPVIGYYFESRL